MIDKVKRKTIKTLGIVAGAGALAASSSHAATAIFGSGIDTTDMPLADIHVASRISALTNDVEVVITNKGTTPTTITHMTPSYTVTHRGQFNFAKLFEHGALRLTPGESVSVPLEQRQITLAGKSAPLMQSLQKSMSMITESESFAKLSIVDSAIMA